MFESIALPPPPPRDEGAGGDDAQMAAGLQEGEQAAWVRRAGAEARRRRLEESDARTGRVWEQERSQGMAQRLSAAAARSSRGAEGGSSTAAARLQRGVERARTGGAADGGASSSLSSPAAAATPDATPQRTATPRPVTAAPDNAAGLATCPCCREDMPESQIVRLACNHAVCGGCLLRMRSSYTGQTNCIDLTYDSGATSDGTLARRDSGATRARLSCFFRHICASWFVLAQEKFSRYI